MKFQDYDVLYSAAPHLTLKEFAAEHGKHELLERDDNAMIAESLSIEEIQDRVGTDAEVEYLGVFQDSDRLHFLAHSVDEDGADLEVLVFVF